jgi:hypothetical protein
MRIYWDRIALAAPAQLALEPRPLRRLEATLSERGFSAERAGGLDYDYERGSRASPWKLMPGSYTRTGDVDELIARSDDLFVVARPGDALALAFDARGLPALPDGWTRTFLLKGDGFSKEMDVHSASPDVAAPLPFHGMKTYPYAGTPPQLERNADKQAQYNIRRVLRPLPPLELAREDAHRERASSRTATPLPRRGEGSGVGGH